MFKFNDFYSTIVEVNSSREFIYSQIVNGKVNHTQKIRELHKKSKEKKKSRGKEREIPLNQRDPTKSERSQGILNTLYKFHLLGSIPFLDEPPGAKIPCGVVIDGTDISDLYNCMFARCDFLINA